MNKNSALSAKIKHKLPKETNLLVETRSSISTIVDRRETITHSGKATHKLLSQCTPFQQDIYWFLYEWYLNFDGRLFVAESTIAKAVGCTTRTVGNALIKLRSLRLLQTIYRHRRTLIYRVGKAHQEMRSRQAAARKQSQLFSDHDDINFDLVNKETHNQKILAMMMVLPTLLGGASRGWVSQDSLAEASAVATGYYSHMNC